MIRLIVITGIVTGLCGGVVPEGICGGTPEWETLRNTFVRPDRELQSRPLWFWNVNTITPERTVEITERSAHDSGYAGFGILPCFGPKSNAEGTEVYLTEEYFARYGTALEAARRNGMKMCLYDEYWFPSGAAGGWLKRKYPDAVIQELICEVETMDVSGTGQEVVIRTEGVRDERGTLMSVVAIRQETGERIVLSSPETETMSGYRNLSPGSWRVLSFYCRPSSQPLVDYLNADAVRKFIEVTHEEYYRRFPEYFGTTIDSVFYDEPPLYRVNTWTPGFNEKFRERYTDPAKPVDPASLYPDLFFDVDETTPAARVMMFGMRSELFATEYIGQMDSWCREHGVKLTGHMD
ncbi:MAG: hypothetical protein Q4C47_06215, partial [Planctomycetia bacterium]|nr:hypothetical protein [Planctomycetia bacterium]